MIIPYQAALVAFALIYLYLVYKLLRNAPEFQCWDCGNYYGSPLYLCPQCGFKVGDSDE